MTKKTKSLCYLIWTSLFGVRSVYVEYWWYILLALIAAEPALRKSGIRMFGEIYRIYLRFAC